MMNRNKKSRKFSKFDVFNAIATISSMKAKYSAFFAFNHFFSNNSSISVRIERKKKIEIRIRFFCHSVNCYVIRSRIVNCTKSNFWFWKQQTVKSSNHAFFESFTKMIFRFLTQTDYESKKTIDAKITMIVLFQVSEFDAKITTIMIFQISIFDAKITMTMFFQINTSTYKHTSSRISMQSIWKKIISKNFDVKKKTHVKHSKFKSTKSANRISI